MSTKKPIGESRLTSSQSTSAGKVVVVSDDILLRRGLTSFLLDSGIPVTAFGASTTAVVSDVLALWNSEEIAIVIVDLMVGRGSDLLAGCTTTAQIMKACGAPLVVAALGRGPLDPLPELRVAEAGAQFYLDASRLGFRPDCLLAILAGEEPVNRLPTRWELRERLGLRWDGSLAPLVDTLAELPACVWQGRPKQRRLPLTRREIQALRRLATAAGFLPPDPARFSTAYRRPPADPEWSKVWSIGAELLGRSRDSGSHIARGSADTLGPKSEASAAFT